MAHDDAFSQLEQEYEGTRLITVVQREDGPPQVEWDHEAWGEEEILGCLVKSMLFMAFNEYVRDVIDEWLDDDEETEDEL